MICPHCLKNIHVEEAHNWDPTSTAIGTVMHNYVGHDGLRHCWVERAACPACEKFILTLVHSDALVDIKPLYIAYSLIPDEGDVERIRIWPRSTGRPPAPPEVPDEFKTDYQEACLILADSPRASAALSRGCLQLILREKLGAKDEPLQKQVDWAITSAGLPSSIVDLLDVPRKVGNRAAHPKLSKVGKIVPVEPWEAEWCLEVIEALFDYVFVLPAKTQERLARLK